MKSATVLGLMAFFLLGCITPYAAFCRVIHMTYQKRIRLLNRKRI